MKRITLLLIYLIFILIISVGQPILKPGVKAEAYFQTTDPYALIDEVNSLRINNGLAPYSINPILMSIAQSHASFMASNGVSHYGVGGSSPYERALAAGYPLAGDLTLGGFFSENITAGSQKSVSDAVIEWQGDAPHLNTMLSSNLTEIGAGMVNIDGYIYYVIDCGRPTNSGVAQPIPTSMASVLENIPLAPVVVNTLVPNTPDALGKIFHTVAAGETLWLIGVSYGLSAQQIRDANPGVFGDEIYVGQKLYLPGGKTQTSQAVSPTNEVSPTYLPITSTPTSLTPTPTITLSTAVTLIPENGLIIGEEISDGSTGLIGLLLVVFFGIFLAILLFALTRRRDGM